MAPSPRKPMTAGPIRDALRRFLHERAAETRAFPDDPVLAQLEAARWLACELELVTQELVVTARRGERRYSWRLIGAAMGTSGQAAGKWARQHGLPIDQPATDYAHEVGEGRALVAALHSRRYHGRPRKA
ncbi:hypothetical protein [Actinoallomurus sp. NPDC052274]|uniref:hypothetical protein n=1 Tax=Actinoallomurus sp. NPDC052274 TaxID=3155420 RepID=UPI00342913D4